MTTTVREQQRQALERANEVRLGHATVRRELAARRISLAQALDDDRAHRMSIFSLLCAQWHWGPWHAARLLRGLVINERRCVGDLTEHQKRLIVARANGGTGR